MRGANGQRRGWKAPSFGLFPRWKTAPTRRGNPAVDRRVTNLEREVSRGTRRAKGSNGWGANKLEKCSYLGLKAIMRNRERTREVRTLRTGLAPKPIKGGGKPWTNKPSNFGPKEDGPRHLASPCPQNKRPGKKDKQTGGHYVTFWLWGSVSVEEHLGKEKQEKSGNNEGLDQKRYCLRFQTRGRKGQSEGRERAERCVPLIRGPARLEGVVKGSKKIWALLQKYFSREGRKETRKT